jgi:hypothetical protein
MIQKELHAGFVYMLDCRVAAERMQPFEDAEHLC